jgi:tRNA modification GTPase
MRRQIIRIRAMIEAELDFADEDDVPEAASERVWPMVEDLREDIARAVRGHRAAEIVRHGFQVVVTGSPNVGKSSLLNALAGREAAIVTDVPGTTRDLVSVALDIGGRKIVVTDTAGLRDTADPVELIGIGRAREAASTAHLVIRLDAFGAPEHPVGEEQPEVPVLRVLNKVDLHGSSEHKGYDLLVSARSGEGLEALLERLAAYAQDAGGDHQGAPTRERQLHHLLACDQALGRLQKDAPLELISEDLREAGDRLGRITGAIGVDDLLDVIFSEFCIGK